MCRWIALICVRPDYRESTEIRHIQSAQTRSRSELTSTKIVICIDSTSLTIKTIQQFNLTYLNFCESTICNISRRSYWSKAKLISRCAIYINIWLNTTYYSLSDVLSHTHYLFNYSNLMQGTHINWIYLWVFRIHIYACNADWSDCKFTKLVLFSFPGKCRICYSYFGYQVNR